MVLLIGWDCTRYAAAMGLDWLGAYDTWSFSFLLCIHHIKVSSVHVTDLTFSWESLGFIVADSGFRLGCCH